MKQLCSTGARKVERQEDNIACRGIRDESVRIIILLEDSSVLLHGTNNSLNNINYISKAGRYGNTNPG